MRTAHTIACPLAHRLFVLAVAGLAVSATTKSLGQTLTVIPALTNPFGSSAAGISSNGSVVSGTSNTAYRWTPSGGVQSLGFLSIVQISLARGITPDGAVITGTAAAPGCCSQAFRWTTSGMQALGSLPGGGGSNGFDISSSGNVIVGQSDTASNPNPNRRAFRWVNGSGMTNLGLLPGHLVSSATGVSADGNTVVGWSENPSFVKRAFRWTSGTGMVDLGTLPGDTASVANAASSDGSVIVGGSAGGGLSRGFRWTQATGMVAIPNLPTATTGAATGCTPDGQVLIGSSGTNGFLWSADQGTINITTRLINLGINLTGIGQITTGEKISSDGTAMIVNSGSEGMVIRGMPCLRPPQVTANPSNQSYCTTTSFSISSNATGATSIQWLKDGVPIANGTTSGGAFVQGATGTTLTIFSPSAFQTGSYSCRFTNQCGTSLSSAAAISVSPPPVVLIQPSANTVCIGASSSSLGIVVSPPPPATTLTYRWQRRNLSNVYVNIFDGPTGNGSNFVGTGGQTLIILGPVVADTQMYRCLVTNECNGVTFTTPAQITVNGLISVTQQPADVIGCIGDNDTSMSVAAGPGTGFTYQWYRRTGRNIYTAINDGPTGSGAQYGGTQSATLTWFGTYAADFEFYRCEIVGPCNTVTTNAASFGGTSAPSINTLPSGYSQCAGSTQSFSVGLSAGAIGAVYSWRFNGVPINLLDPRFTVVSNALGTTLTITNIGPADAGSYRCFIFNACDSVLSAQEPLGVTICCLADIVGGDGNPPGDGNVDGNDFQAFLNAFGASDSLADLVGGDGNPPPDGNVDGNDFQAFLNAFGAGC